MRQGVNFLWIVKNIIVLYHHPYYFHRPWNDHQPFSINPQILHNFSKNQLILIFFFVVIFQVSKGRQNTAVKEQLYKSPVKKEQSSIWSEPITADFPYPFVMRKALLIGVSIVWNHGLWESSMQGNLSHKIFFKNLYGILLLFNVHCATNIKSDKSFITYCHEFDRLTWVVYSN